MIDNLSILLSHALIAIAFYFLLSRDDLDKEEPPEIDKEPDGFAVHNTIKNRNNSAWNTKSHLKKQNEKSRA